MEISIVFWYWWIAAAILLAIEMIMPGFVFLWMAMSAFFTGMLLVAMPAIGLGLQLFIFALLSVVSVFAWKLYMERHPIKTDHPHLNQRSAQYIGRTFTLEKGIINGHGKIRVDGAVWRVEGLDCPAGSTIKIVDSNAMVLKVVQIY